MDKDLHFKAKAFCFFQEEIKETPDELLVTRLGHHYHWEVIYFLFYNLEYFL